jgi:hypothetical protein
MHPPADVDSAAFALEIDALLAEDTALAGLSPAAAAMAGAVAGAVAGAPRATPPGDAPSSSPAGCSGPARPPRQSPLPPPRRAGKNTSAARHSNVERARRERLNSLIREVNK